VRVTVQLIDAEAGVHVWADRYDRKVTDVFAVQDEITSAVTHAIEPAISHAERQRAIRKPPGNLDAWEAYQCGLWHLARHGTADAVRAHEFFRRAIELDSLFASPHAMLAFSLLHQVSPGDNSAIRQYRLAEAEARTAIELDREESCALSVLSWVSFFFGHHEAALEQAERAISVNPSDVGAYLTKGRSLTHSGRPEEARQLLLTALQLSPRDPFAAWVHSTLSISHYFSANYVEAAKGALRCIQDYPEFPYPYRWLAASLGQLGRNEEASEALRQAIAMSPASFDTFVGSRPPWYRPDDYEHALNGLRKAGWEG
jgi:adenylate cyclase